MCSIIERKTDRFSDYFIERLEQLVEKEDRGALATLRRGLSKDIPFEVYRFMPFSGKRWHDEAALMVAPLFSFWHQGEVKMKSVGEKDLGASMLDLVYAMSLEGENRDDVMKRVERRFGAMLNCHADDLKYHLRHAISLLRTKGVPVNWRLLCYHIQHWNHEDRWVQRSWARSFWAPRSESGEPLEVDTSTEVSEETDAEESFD